MHLHHAATLAPLADALASVTTTPLATPFHRDCIVVPGAPLARWLSLRLATRFGVWANPWFPTLRGLAEELATTTLGARDAEPFAPDALTWSIAAILPILLPEPALADVRAYLEGADATKRLALSARIARLFDRYATHRPALVARWEAGADSHWQALLWRALVARHGVTHRAARSRELCAALSDVPARVCVFGVSALSSLDLDLLKTLGAQTELHVFALSPSPRARTGDAGHPLVTTLGVSARDLRRQLEARFTCVDHPAYDAVPSTTMLGQLQAAISRDEAPAKRAAILDRTIALHSCHGPMRELEVLRDQLLALLQDDPTLEARDILVLSPDLDTYAPFVDAVFGIAREQLPFRIVDRPARAALPVVDAFLAILDTARTRLGATEVLDLLTREAVRGRFDLSEEDVDVLRDWATDAGARWGADETHRADEGQPALRENTWRFALDRLLLGYAMARDEQAMFAGVLPYDDVEGGAAGALGGLAAFCEILFAVRSELTAPRTVAAWRDTLASVLERTVQSTRTTAWQHQLVREALDALADRAKAAGFDEPVPLSAVRDELDAALEAHSSAGDFVSGGVTFCALRTGRCVPSRVVVLLGMSDGAFPRRDAPLAFDLLAQSPEPGDPSARSEDRGVFLEAILAAREHLLITYVGQSIQSNRDRPPSVLVSELLDVLDESFAGARDHVVTRHPLHAFSPSYFDKSNARLFSFSGNLCDGSRRSLGERTGLPPFLTESLAAPIEERDVVTLDELISFYEDPARALIRDRLGITLKDDLRVVDDREPMELDTLQAYGIGADLLERQLDGRPLAPRPVDVPAIGNLPLGTVGVAEYDDLREHVAAVGARVLELRPDRPGPALEIDLDLEGLRVIGWLRGVSKARQVYYRYAKVHAKNLIRAWIHHLALSATSKDVGETCLVGRGENKAPVVWRFNPVKPKDAKELLEDLVELRSRGLQVPLPLLPEPAFAYANARHDKKSEDEALDKAARVYEKDWPNAYVDKLYGESDVCSRGFRVFDDQEIPDFAALAERVYGPLIAHGELDS